MIENFDVSLTYVLAEEGGYGNHPKDPGGATNKGVIQREYNAYRRNRGLPQRSVKSIELPEVQEIYKKSYWDSIRADEIPSGLDYCVFDYAVNSGPSQAIKTLQRAINSHGDRNIAVDGRIGDVTLEGAKSYDPKALIEEVCGGRDTFYHSLKSLFPTFGKGWMSRLGRVHDRALAMVSSAPAPAAPAVVPELGGDAPKPSKLPDLVTGVSGVAATGLLAVVNNPYALAFALTVLLIGSVFLYRKYVS